MPQLQSFLPVIYFALGITVLFITFKIKLEKDIKKQTKISEDFFVKEFDAAFSRKKEIPDSLLISISLHDLPIPHHSDYQKLYHQLLSYGNYKMANLKGYTNLELKQTYGISQFEELVQYEKNYLIFMEALVKYGETFYQNRLIPQARRVLELALNYGCDLSKCYMILADIYFQQKEDKLLERLTQIAEKNMLGSHYLAKVLQTIKDKKKDIN